MKPILLKIKGLNSFSEQQTIDFETLMEHGLFGIFGPTGSGKSTILDAITLALYGEIPRCAGRGLSGIINTQTDSVYVYFEFELGAVSRKRRYSVERIVKRTKAGGTSTDTAIVCDITYESDKKVLGDKVMVTNQVLRDIIGLNAGDFMKSVVLPQGSFSEFLQLDGKPRREMLERIFGLEEYGYKLSDKATAYQRRKNEQMQRLEGQLSSYKNIDKQKLDELNQRKKYLGQHIKNLRKQYEEAQKDFDKYRDIWNLQQELDKASKEYESKVAQKDIYSSKEDRLNRANKASGVKPFIERLENLGNILAKTEKSKLELGEKLQRISEVLGKLEVKWKAAMEQKENILPDLMISRENLTRAVKLFEDIKTLQSERTKLDNQVEDIHKKLGQDDKNKQEIQNILKSVSLGLEDIKKEEQKYIISSLKRQNINRGYEIEKEYNRLLEDNKELNRKRELYKKEIGNNSKEYSEIAGKLAKQQIIMDGLNTERKELDKKCPGDRNSLLDRQNQLNQLRDEIKGAEKTRQDIDKINNKILELSSRAQKYSQERDRNKEEYLQQNDLLGRIEEDIEDAKTRDMAALLAKDLQDGVSCPVCGSKDHPTLAHSAEGTQRIAALKQEKSAITKKLSDIQSLVAASEANLKSINDQIKEEKVKLVDIGGKATQIDMEAKKNELARLEKEFQQFQADLDKWDKDIKDCSKAIEECSFLLSDLKQQGTELSTTLKNNNRILKEAEELYKTNSSKLEETSKIFLEIQSETGISDFSKAVREIQQWDELIESLHHKMDEKSKIIEDSKKAIDELNVSISKCEVESAKLKEQRRQLDNNMNQLKKEIEQLSGGENPMKKLQQVESQISRINKQWKKVSQDWDEQNKLKDEIYKEYNTISQNYILLSNQHKSEAQTLAGMLADKGFIDGETALEYLLSPEEMKKLDQEIKEYHSNINVLKDRIRSIEKKLQDVRIDAQKWGFIQDEVERLKAQLELQKEEFIKVDMNIDSIGEKLADKLRLLASKQALRKQLDHIGQLMSLLKAKKFVDFVAKNQLRHIARGASTRLKDITRGRYALELDAEGNFIIRDDFNGGARRPTHTLSGGETFVTSLSLALALSSRIQMGKASLDFFFLDEGFGTLDSELLDVVISSLEQLRSDSMCVGLISHVEELKQRLPRKLIVSPPISGERGTLVTMD